MYIMTTSDKRYTLKLTYIRLFEFNKRLIECYNPVCADVYKILQSVSSDEQKKYITLLDHLREILEWYVPKPIVKWAIDCTTIQNISPVMSKKLKKEMEYISDSFDFSPTMVEVFYAFLRLLDWSIKTDIDIQIIDGD